MTRRNRHSLLLLAAASVLRGELTTAPDLFDGFADGWRKNWMEQRLFTKATACDVVQVEGRPVLHARSRAANAGLARNIGHPAPTHLKLSWSWKIAHSLAANRRERLRAGDDYAARVFVVFEKSALPLRTRAINCVWAAHQPREAVYASPYSSQVCMVVVRSGDAEAGRWHEENRDVLADYRRFFGEEPRAISAVAVLVDTDNTGLSAEAWFADLRLESGEP